MKKIIVDNDLCIGCGACVGICDKVFEFSDVGIAQSNEDINIIDEMDEEFQLMYLASIIVDSAFNFFKLNE